MKEKLKWKSNISLTTEKDERGRKKQIFKDKVLENFYRFGQAQKSIVSKSKSNQLQTVYKRIDSYLYELYISNRKLKTKILLEKERKKKID